jgi:hypothetical protein
MACECIRTFRNTNIRSSSTTNTPLLPLNSCHINNKNNTSSLSTLTLREVRKEPRLMTRADGIIMRVPTQISIFDNNSSNNNNTNSSNFPGSTCRSRAIIRFRTCPISHKCAFPLDLLRSWDTMTKEVVASAERADEAVDVVVDE